MKPPAITFQGKELNLTLLDCAWDATRELSFPKVSSPPHLRPPPRRSQQNQIQYFTKKGIFKLRLQNYHNLSHVSSQIKLVNTLKKETPLMILGRSNNNKRFTLGRKL